MRCSSFWKGVDKIKYAAKIKNSVYNGEYNMEPIRLTVSNRGYIVLPAVIRKQMEIRPGTQMLLRRDREKIILEMVPSFTKKLAGLTKNVIAETAADVDAYIDAERNGRS